MEVYSHYPKVRLYLDGNLIGEKDVEEMKAVFSLPYQPELCVRKVCAMALLSRADPSVRPANPLPYV